MVGIRDAEDLRGDLLAGHPAIYGLEHLESLRSLE
jgi:hypothetical protein